MVGKLTRLNLISAIFGIAVFTIGVLNVLLIHVVPGVVFLILSSLYLPQANAVIQKNFGFKVSPLVKILLGLVIIWFTLGVSDLGDMID